MSLERRIVLSPALRNETTHLTVEVIGLKQFLKREVHAIAPIVERIGRYIDALGIKVGIAQMLIDSHPILKRKDGEHSWRV